MARPIGKIGSGFIIPALFFVLLVILTKHDVGSANDRSICASVESIVERGTLAIDNSTFATHDKIYYNGHFYGLKDFAALTISPSYALAHNLFGVSFSTNTDAYYLTTLFSVGVLSAIMLLFFHKSLGFLGLGENSKHLFTFALGFSTLVLPYSLTITSQILSAVFLFMGFYFLQKSKYLTDSRRLSIFLSAAFSSYAFMIDELQIVFTLVFLAQIWFNKELKGHFRLYLATMLIFLSSYFLINLILTGLPFGTAIEFDLKPETIHYEGSYWNNPSELDSFRDPTQVFLFNILLGHRGIFLFTPILLLSFLSLYRNVLNRDHPLFKESALFLLGFLILMMVFVKLKYYSGVSFGFRYIIPLTPILMFYLAAQFRERHSGIYYTVFFWLLFISAGMSFLGTYRVWMAYDYEFLLVYLSILGFPLLAVLLVFRPLTDYLSKTFG